MGGGDECIREILIGRAVSERVTVLYTEVLLCCRYLSDVSSTTRDTAPRIVYEL